MERKGKIVRMKKKGKYSKNLMMKMAMTWKGHPKGRLS